jgi:hypothetical protein
MHYSLEVVMLMPNHSKIQGERENVKDLIHAGKVAKAKYDELRRSHDLLLARVPPVSTPNPILSLFGNFLAPATNAPPPYSGTLNQTAIGTRSLDFT